MSTADLASGLVDAVLLLLIGHRYVRATTAAAPDVETLPPNPDR